MSPSASESKTMQRPPEQKKQPPQPFPVAKAQPIQVPTRRPQNFDDWCVNRRDDDPTS